MAVSTLKEKGQITLPAEIRKRLAAKTGDLFDVRIEDGKIVMIPQKLVPVTTRGKAGAKKSGKTSKRDLSRWIAAAPGVYSTMEETDAAIRERRDAWDK